MKNPELNLINKSEYDKLKILDIDIYFCKDKSNIRISLDEIKNILEIIPEKHRKFIPRIYVVNYFCENKEIKGRHLTNLNYVIIYPNAIDELKTVLIHEIGHVLWDKMLLPEQRIKFYSCMLSDVPVTLKKTNILERHIFVLENFANSYQFFLCKIFDSEKYPKIYEFIFSLF